MYKRRHEHIAVKLKTFERFRYHKKDEPSDDSFLNKILSFYERVLAKRGLKEQTIK